MIIMEGWVIFMGTQVDSTITEERLTLEQIKGQYFKVLDKGFVGLVDAMGDDFAIEQAARVSYGKGTRKTSDTRGLIRYLMRHRHTTPFEMVELKFHVRMPMDVMRQWIRHRTASVNEYSTRYSEAVDARQETSPDGWRLQSKSNKQGSSGLLESWDETQIGEHSERRIYDNPGDMLSFHEREFHERAVQVYQERLECGVAKEQARKDLPLSTYTIAYWKIDLHNLFHFLKLRLDPHAQLEIRQYATVMASIVRKIVPMAWEAFEDYVLNASTLTRLDKELLHHQQTNSDPGISWEEYAAGLGMSSREYQEFQSKLFPGEIVIPRLDLLQSKPPEYFEELLNT